MGEKARQLERLTRKVREALEELGRMGESTGDDPEAISSQRELWTAALQEFTAVGANDDDDTIRAAIERGGRWIDAATAELEADEREEWRRAGEE